MAIALCVKGIQESATNHFYETKDFQTEVDLQNAAESGIYAAAEKVQRELAKDKNYLLIKTSSREYHQFKIISTTQKTSSGDISVDVLAERILIFPYKVDYTMFVTTGLRVHDGKKIEEREACMLYSSAEIYSERIGKNFSRQAFAYVELDVDGNSDNMIHFMNNAPNNLAYRPDDPTK